MDGFKLMIDKIEELATQGGEMDVTSIFFGGSGSAYIPSLITDD